MGKKRKDASKRDEAVIKKEEGKSATSSGANAAEAARAPAGGKDNTKASGAGDDEGKAGQQEDVSGSSGGAACMFLFLVLGLVTAATVMAAYAAEDMQFADMPSEVQSWSRLRKLSQTASQTPQLPARCDHFKHFPLQ